MPIFLRLHRLTEKGAGHLKNIEENLSEIENLSKENGLKLLVSYACLGEYDAVTIVESPSEKEVADLNETLKDKGMIETITLKCFSLDELGGLLDKLSSILEGAKKKLDTRGLERRILKTVERDILTVNAYEVFTPYLKQQKDVETDFIDGKEDFVPHVLVVDDEPDFRIMMDRLLSKKGYIVATAQNGEEALMKASDDPPNIAILDIMMPGMTGLEIARRIRDNPQTKDTSIIMLSVIANKENRRMSIWQAGADWHLKKPFDSDELLSILEGERIKHANKDKIKRVLKAMELEKRIKDASNFINPKLMERDYSFLNDLED